MAKFDASTAVEALEYDFTEYVPRCKGVIPEPTRDQITAFFNQVRDLKDWAGKAQEALDRRKNGQAEPDPEDNADVAQFLATLDEDGPMEQLEAIVAAVADLCSQQPSKEQIDKLPFRVQTAFFGWVAEQLNPKAQSAEPIMRRSPEDRRRAAKST